MFSSTVRIDKIVELIDTPPLSAAEYGKLVIIHFAYIVAVNKNFSACGTVNTADDEEERLPLQACTDNGNKFALFNRERNIVNRIMFSPLPCRFL